MPSPQTTLAGTRRLLTLVLALIGLLLGVAPTVNAQNYFVIHEFGGPQQGANPYSGLLVDRKRNLYGTTENGGVSCLLNPACGTVFELMPDGFGGWTEKTLHNFDGGDGGFPTAPVVFDRHGNLYTTSNCVQDCFYGYNGNVIKLAPNANGAWPESVLYDFPDNGCSPTYFGTGGLVVCSIAFDHSGRLYGATVVAGQTGQDCPSGCGTAFFMGQLSISSWYHIVIHDFAGGSSDGRFPQGLLTFDAGNNIYGTTGAGGSANHGVVYMLTPNPSGPGWRETILHTFQGGSSDGANPIAGVVLDAAGNVYGTTSQGGSAGLGTVYRLTPQSNGTWTETVLYSFQGGNDASTPNSSLSFDSAGALYGTAGGGAHGQGAIFKLKPSSGGQWTESVYYTFTGGLDGGQPYGGVSFDTPGNLYGTASVGGTNGQNGGVAFQIVP